MDIIKRTLVSYVMSNDKRNDLFNGLKGPTINVIMAYCLFWVVMTTAIIIGPQGLILVFLSMLYIISKYIEELKKRVNRSENLSNNESA